jgi:hypothetical protein
MSSFQVTTTAANEKSRLAGVYARSGSSDPPTWRNGNVLIARAPVNSFEGGLPLDARAEQRTCNELSSSNFKMSPNFAQRVTEGSCTNYPQTNCEQPCALGIPSADYFTRISEACCSCGGGSVLAHTYDWLRVLYAEGAWLRDSAKAANFSVGAWSLNSAGVNVWTLFGNQPSCCTSRTLCRNCNNISRWDLTMDYLRANNATVQNVALTDGSIIGNTLTSDVESCYGCCYLAQDPNIALPANIVTKEKECGWLLVSGSSLHASMMGLYFPLLKDGRTDNQRVAYQQYQGSNYIFFSARVCTQQPPVCNSSGPGMRVPCYDVRYSCNIYRIEI